MCHAPQNISSGPAQGIGWVPGSSGGLIGKEDGGRERIFCSSSHMWPLVFLSSTLDSCSRTMRELEVATSVVRGSGLLIYSWDPDSAAGWTESVTHSWGSG